MHELKLDAVMLQSCLNFMHGLGMGYEHGFYLMADLGWWGKVYSVVWHFPNGQVKRIDFLQDAYLERPNIGSVRDLSDVEELLVASLS